MKKNKFINKISSLLFYISILTFFIAFGFAHNPPGGWYQQFLPSDIPNISDITFTDSLTGYAVTVVDAENKSYIIRTTNGGDNWNTVLQDSGGRAFTKVKFINSGTGFACTKYNSGSGKLFKTIDMGNNWITLNNPNTFYSYDDISVLSELEIWSARDLPFDGGVYRTTNGGQTWERKYYDISRPADRIYMINSRIGFISNGDNTNSFLRKTTDAGQNWSEILNGDGWYKITFQDSLIGWRALFQNVNFQKTTDGGLNWTTLINVATGNPTLGITAFKIINDTIWGVNPSGNILYPNNQFRGVIFRTTDAGKNWGYQLPDTSFRIPFFVFCDFVNPNVGWAYSGVHTVSGGDTTTYPLTTISNLNNQIIGYYNLSQNYPNPFNPSTKIKYQLKKSGFVNIKVFNILGKEIEELINERQSAGEYDVRFEGNEYPGGVYFYSLYVDNILIDTKKMILIR